MQYNLTFINYVAVVTENGDVEVWDTDEGIDTEHVDLEHIHPLLSWLVHFLAILQKNVL